MKQTLESMVNFLYSGSISYAKKIDLYKFLGNLKEIFGFCDEIDFFEDSNNESMPSEFSTMKMVQEFESSENGHFDKIPDGTFRNNPEKTESNDFILEDVQDNYNLNNSILKNYEALDTYDIPEPDESVAETEEILIPLDPHYENDPLKSDLVTLGKMND